MAVTIQTLAFLSKQVYANYGVATNVPDAFAVNNYAGFTNVGNSGLNDPNGYYCETWIKNNTNEIILVNRGTFSTNNGVRSCLLPFNLKYPPCPDPYVLNSPVLYTT